MLRRCCCCFGSGDTDRSSDPPLLSPKHSTLTGGSPYSPSSPRHVRGRAAASANEYLSKVVNLCRLGQGTFALVSLVIDKIVLEALPDSESAMPAYFAVKRISKRGEASRLAPGEGGAVAERKTHALLEHPFFPILHSASRSAHNFYIAFPFALGGDVSKALARRSNSIRGFDKAAAQRLHAQAQVGGTLAGMKELIQGESWGSDFGGGGGFGKAISSNNNNGGNKNGGNSAAAASNGATASIDPNNFNPEGTPETELRATLHGLPISFVCVVAFELLSAISFLNDKGFTHYDIRPGNLLLCEGGHVILGDFGMIREERGVVPDPNAQNDVGLFTRFFRALGGGNGNSTSSSNSNGASAAAANNNTNNGNGNGSNNLTNSQSTILSATGGAQGSLNLNSNSSGNYTMSNSNSGGGGVSSPRGVTETANEKRSQLYLAPEHLTAATNIEAENDCKRLSDIWSYGVLLLELALGAHPFTPVQGGDNAFAMLRAIKNMQFRRVPTSGIKPVHGDRIIRVIELLNDLASKIFVPRAQRMSATELMGHDFFASHDVRALVGAANVSSSSSSSSSAASPATSAEVYQSVPDSIGGVAAPVSPRESQQRQQARAAQNLPPLLPCSPGGSANRNVDFFNNVVNKKLLKGPVSLDPARVCKDGGCPTAGTLKQWLTTLAPCPQHVAPSEFAPTLVMDALEDDDSRELIDLRFFGSLSEEDLRKWNAEDNESVLCSYDPDWAPDDMQCLRAPLSSHKSFGGGSNIAGIGGNGNGGGVHEYLGDGSGKAAPAMPEQPGFTFVRPTNTSFGAARG